MRFRFFILLTLTVAAIAGTKPFYAQDDLFDEPAEPAVEADWGGIAADSDPGAEDELNDLFDDDEPVADANRNDAVDDLFGDGDPTDDVPAEDLFGEAKPASNADADGLDDLFDDPKPAVRAKPLSHNGDSYPARTAADDDMTTADDTMDGVARAESRSQSQGVQTLTSRLDKMPAEQAAAAVRALYPRRQREGLKVTSDSRNNVIIVRGPADLVREVQMVLKALVLMADGNTKDQYAEQSNPAGLDDFGSPNAAPPRSRGSLNEIQKQILELQVRHQSVTDRESPGYDGSGKQARKYADELRTTIRQAFDVRQRQQQQQIRQLQQRLSLLQQRVQVREQKRQQIIEQVVNGLLSPDAADGQTSQRRRRLLDALGNTDYTTTSEAALRQFDSSLVQASSLLNQAVNAEPPIQSALDVERTRQMMREGYVSGDQLKQLQGQLTTQQLNVQLEQEQIEKIRQFEAEKLNQQRAEQIAADADFETNIKRLELNLAEAEAELEYTTVEFDALKRTHAKLGNSLSASQLRKVALQQRQATIKVQRAKLELDAAKRRGAKRHGLRK